MNETYADQRAHDVTWMTAAEREAYDRRLAAVDAAVEQAGGPCTMSVGERGNVTVTWWWQSLASLERTSRQVRSDAR